MPAAPRPLPMTAGALIVGGMVHSHTSMRGDNPPNLHPIVAEILAGLPSEKRERYAGWCAEVALLSDRLHEHFLSGVVSGGWMDRLDAEGRPAADNMPASTLYHVMGIVLELDPP